MVGYQRSGGCRDLLCLGEHLRGTTRLSDTSDTPAGWYKNPQGVAPWRYWDGQSWTDHVHDDEETAPQRSIVETPETSDEQAPLNPAAVPEVVGAPAMFSESASVPQPQPEQQSEPLAAAPAALVAEPTEVHEAVEAPPAASDSTESDPAATTTAEPPRKVSERPSRVQYQEAYAELAANKRAKSAQWVGVVLAGLIAAGAYLPLWSLDGSDTLVSDEQATRVLFVVAALLGAVGAALAMLRMPQGPTTAIGASIPVACVSALFIREFVSLDDGVPEGISTPSMGVGLIVLGFLIIVVVLLALVALVHASSGRTASGPPVFHAICVLAGLGLAALSFLPESDLTMWDQISSGGDVTTGVVTILIALVGPITAMVFLWGGTRAGAGLAFGTFASLAVIYVSSAEADGSAGEVVLMNVTEPWPAAICALVGLAVAAIASFGPGPGGKPDEVIEAYDVW
jgi:hypothetical protein